MAGELLAEDGRAGDYTISDAKNGDSYAIGVMALTLYVPILVCIASLQRLTVLWQIRWDRTASHDV